MMVLADIFGIGALIDGMICFIETGIILFTNLCLNGIALIVGGLVSSLPSMPSVPTFPTWVEDGYHHVAYWFPVDWAITLAESFLVFYLAWQLVAVGFRWAKILSGSA